MEKKTYCDFSNALDIKSQDPNKNYHEQEYGFPISNDNELFARFVLEINQAGLSWTLILKKKDNFYKAYDNFIIEKVGAYTQIDIDRLLQDSGIIRNKLKIHATIFNARRISDIQVEYGSFKKWLDLQYLNTKEEWVLVFKKNFKFTGGEIVNEFLMSTGYLEGAHHRNCPIYDHVIKSKPKWLER